jgi:two-component system, cell cycle response regulator DivK
MHDLSEWRVLIVDDEPDNLGVIKLVLEFHDAQVRTATSGAECLELLNEEIPSLLLVDIQMPEMSGYELLEKIHLIEACQGIPVIAVTAHTMEGDPERVMEAGFNGYIPKPINAMNLVDDILTALHQQ